MKRQQYSMERKVMTLRELGDGETVRNLSRRDDIPLSTLYGWVRLWFGSMAALNRWQYSNKLIGIILGELRAGETVRNLSRRYGVSERTIRRWKARFGNLGAAKPKECAEEPINQASVESDALVHGPSFHGNVVGSMTYQWEVRISDMEVEKFYEHTEGWPTPVPGRIKTTIVVEIQGASTEKQTISGLEIDASTSLCLLSMVKNVPSSEKLRSDGMDMLNNNLPGKDEVGVGISEKLKIGRNPPKRVDIQEVGPEGMKKLTQQPNMGKRNWREGFANFFRYVWKLVTIESTISSSAIISSIIVLFL